MTFWQIAGPPLACLAAGCLMVYGLRCWQRFEEREWDEKYPSYVRCNRCGEWKWTREIAEVLMSGGICKACEKS